MTVAPPARRRPCASQHPDPVPDECDACWAFVYDPHLRAKWGGDGPAKSDPPVRPSRRGPVRPWPAALPPRRSSPRRPDRVDVRYCDKLDQWSWTVYGDDGRPADRGWCDENDEAWTVGHARRSELVGKGSISLDWAVGVTTAGIAAAEWARLFGRPAVPRSPAVLARTLRSLAAAGFPRPHLFVDGGRAEDFAWCGLETTCRSTPTLTWGNWFLSLQELVVRRPFADRFAVFQDDMVCVRNLRRFLERWYPPRGYLNLYTFPSNEGADGWHEARVIGRDGDILIQGGQGAVALVFDRAAAVALLAAPTAVRKAFDPRPLYRHKKADGGVVTALNRAGFREWVHTPSLVQHTGLVSSMGNARHELAASFPGEDFDAMSLPANVSDPPANNGIGP